MIQQPQQKPPSNLKGLRILILSLAVMTVGGGLMLFVYAFSKAHESLNNSAAAVDCEAPLALKGAQLLSVHGVEHAQLDAVIRTESGDYAIIRMDRCSGEEVSRQTLTLER